MAENRIEIVVGAQDNSKLDIDGLKARLQAVAKTYEAKLKVAVDKGDIATVDRIGASLATMSRRIDSSRFGEAQFNRAHASLSRLDADLEKIGGSGASGGLLASVISGLAGLGPVAGLSGAGLGIAAAAAVALGLALAPVLAALIPITLGFGAFAAAIAVLPGVQRQAGRDMGQLKDRFHQLAEAVKPELLKAFATGMKIIEVLMPALRPLMIAAGRAVDQFLHQLLDWVRSPSGQAFIQWLRTDGPRDIKILGRVFWDVAVAIGVALDHIFRAANWLYGHLRTFFTKDVPAAFSIFLESVIITFDEFKLAALRTVLFITTTFGHLPGAMGKPFRDASADIRRTMSGIEGDIASRVRQIQGDLNQIHGKSVTISIFGKNDVNSGLFNAPGHAKGTSGAAPGWAWVGEQGRELVHFHGGETVLSHGQSMAAARGYAGGTGWNFRDVFHPSVGAFMGSVSSSISGAEDRLANAMARAIQRVAAREVASGSLPHGPASGSAGVAQRYAMSILGRFGWGASQWPPLLALWNRESGWNANAVNPSSGAYGIPQALGHGHPFNLGDYVAQIWWGLRYILGRYGSPSGAWAHEEAVGWYGKGLRNGVFTRPTLIGVGESGAERVNITPAGAGGDSLVVEWVGPYDLIDFLRTNIRIKYGGNVTKALGH